MEQNNNKYLLIAGIAIIVVIALAIAVPHFKKSTSTIDSGVSAVPGLETPQTNASTPASSWDETLKKYSDSTITFATDCTASPITQTLPKSVTVLLVNNSDIQHTITVGTTSYTVGARHYKTAYLGARTGNTIVSCDNRQNAASIGVQQ